MSNINNILRDDYEKEKNKLHSDRLRNYQKEIKETFNKTLKNNYISFLKKSEELTFEEQEGAKLFFKFLLDN